MQEIQILTSMLKPNNYFFLLLSSSYLPSICWVPGTVLGAGHTLPDEVLALELAVA